MLSFWVPKMKERLQKIISAAGVCSRRKAEELILSGAVTVNGVAAALGQSADPDLDTVCVNGAPLQKKKKNKYILLHKPRGYLTTLSDNFGRPTVMDLLKGVEGRVYPVGRLDMDSEGLLLLTDDGDTAHRLMHPAAEISKVYSVFVSGEDIRAAIKSMNAMRSLDGEKIAPPQVTLVEAVGGRAEINVVIHEGKNRQVRRMCAACGLRVIRLIRIAEGPLTLGDLPAGSWRYLSAGEIAAVKKEI